jgi:hypothetical protein
MKKAALEKLSRNVIFSFFSLKSIKWAGRWGRLYAFFQRLYTMRKYHIPQPQKIRNIKGSFAWIDHRLIRNGFIRVMTHTDMALYLFLVLAADKNGVSFYRKEKICETLSLDYSQFDIAKDRLIDMRLIAFGGYSIVSPNGYYQVLPVPAAAPNFSQKITGQLVTQLADSFKVPDK